MKNISKILPLILITLFIASCTKGTPSKSHPVQQVSTMEKDWQKKNQTLTGKIVRDPKFNEEGVYVFITNNGGEYLITKDSKYNQLCTENQEAEVKGDLEHRYGMYRYNDTVKIRELKCLEK